MIGLVPAAGHARRLQPLPCSKEVLWIAGKPVMDHIIERMRIAGCTDIVVVTRPEKADVQDRARSLGARVVLARPKTVSASLYAGLQGVDRDEIVLLGFPDTIWDPPDGYLRLLEVLRDPFTVALGLFPAREPRRSDVVTVDDSGVVDRVNVKPARSRSQWIWGCAAARTTALDGITSVTEPGYHWDTLARQRHVAGVPLGSFLDIGTKEALRDLRLSEEVGR